MSDQVETALDSARALMRCQRERQRSVEKNLATHRECLYEVAGELFDFLGILETYLGAAAEMPREELVRDLSGIVEESIARLKLLGLSRVGKPGDEFDSRQHKIVGRQTDDNRKADILVEVLRPGVEWLGVTTRKAEAIVSTGSNK